MKITDFHNHLIPGVDDGAGDEHESVEAVRGLMAQGVASIVTTPHLEASLTVDERQLAARLAEIDAGWETLGAAVHREGIDVVLHRGVELSLDTPQPDVGDPRLRLGGGPFLLMEFPFMSVPPHSVRAVRALRDQGVIPVIAHPERYHNLDASLRLPGEWRDAGAYLQVNGGSLLGRYGTSAREHAFELLARGWADYLSSDYHGRGDPQVDAYREVLFESGAGEQAEQLMSSNPARLLEGRAPLPVVPFTVRISAWERLRKLLR